MITEFIIAGFFIFAIGCFFIKDYFQNANKKNTSSYKPLLDDSYSERIV